MENYNVSSSKEEITYVKCVECQFSIDKFDAISCYDNEMKSNDFCSNHCHKKYDEKEK